MDVALGIAGRCARAMESRAQRIVLDEATHARKGRAVQAFRSQIEPDSATGQAPILPEHVLARLTRPYEVILIYEQPTTALLRRALPRQPHDTWRKKARGVHRRVTGASHHSIAQRALSYRKVYFDFGLLFDPTLKMNTQPGLPADIADDDAMERLIADARTQSAPLPNAVFAYNDAAALATMRVCIAHGRRVLEDIAFVGFDDMPAAALDRDRRQGSARAMRRRVAVGRPGERARPGRHARRREFHSSSDLGRSTGRDTGLKPAMNMTASPAIAAAAPEEREIDFRSRDFLLSHVRDTLAFYAPAARDPSGGFFHFCKDDCTIYNRMTCHLVSSTRFVFNYARCGVSPFRRRELPGRRAPRVQVSA